MLPHPTLKLFGSLRARVCAAFPGFAASLRVGKHSEFPQARAFAYCLVNGPPFTIVVRPDFGRQGRARQAGLLSHELGHAVLIYLGYPKHSERDADEAARLLFGKRVRYDKIDVQTWGPGKKLRPAHLPR